MKWKIFFICCLLFFKGMAQKPVSSISISMASTMPANISDWASLMPPVIIQANIRTDSNRSVPGYLKEARILVTIKSGSGNICGAYTPTTAPDANITSLVKLYRGPEIEKLLGQTCTLNAGSYMLCVQFFGNQNGSQKAISEEICKQFTIQGNKTETYTPPQNVMPADGKAFTEIEAKQPITIRWTPIVPRPQTDVIYKVRVIEIRKDQSAAEAMKTGSSLVEKEVVNQTQLVAGSVSSLAIAKDSKYGWYVEASDKQGKSLGTSGITVFGSNTQNMVMQNCAFNPKLDSIYCTGPCGNGKTGYRVRIKLDNTGAGNTLMDFADAANYSIHTPIPAYANVNTQNNVIQAWNTLPSPFGAPNVSIVTTQVLPFYPSTIAAGTAPTREVDICVPNNAILPIRLRVFISMASSNGAPGLCDDDVLINTLPACPCTFCTDNMIVFNGANTITEANNVLTLNNNISIPGIPIKQFKAELIGFSYYPQSGNGQCWVCNKDDDRWGNFVGGIFSSPFPAMVNGVFPSLPCCGGNSHHTIGWWSNTPATIANNPLQLQISLPPASTLSCCPYNVEVCVRYTFTDAECRSCSVVKCFSYVRQPQIVRGPLPNYDLNNAVPEAAPQMSTKN